MKKTQNSKNLMVFYPKCKSPRNIGRKILVGIEYNGFIYVGISTSYKGTKTRQPSKNGGKEWVNPKKPDQFNLKNGRSIALVRSISAIKFAERCDETSKQKLQNMIDRKYLLVIEIPQDCKQINKLFVDTLNIKYGSIRTPKKKKETEEKALVLN